MECLLLRVPPPPPKGMPRTLQSYMTSCHFLGVFDDGGIMHRTERCKKELNVSISLILFIYSSVVGLMSATQRNADSAAGVYFFKHNSADAQEINAAAKIR